MESDEVGWNGMAWIGTAESLWSGYWTRNKTWYVYLPTHLPIFAIVEIFSFSGVESGHRYQNLEIDVQFEGSSNGCKGFVPL